MTNEEHQWDSLDIESSAIWSKCSPRRELLFEDTDEENALFEDGEVLMNKESVVIEDDEILMNKENALIEDGENLTDFNYLKDLSKIEARMPAEMIPKIGMEFETEEASWQFYLAYAKQVGFGIRRHRSHRNTEGKLIDMTFCCSAQGKRKEDKRDVLVKVHRPETRFGCLAMLRVNCRKSGRFRIIQFVGQHNHHLTSPNKTHLIRCHRIISSSQAADIEMANSVGIPPKAAHDLMARQAGGRNVVGFIPEDYKNYLRTQRNRYVKPGDTGGVLEYLKQKQVEYSNFFYAIQLDSDELITNIFWCDSRMKADYAKFGDVISFDTTYRKNNEGRPIALFVGVNHHKQTTIFGAALLYDETALSFEWLFETFCKAMDGVKPRTILTDQDPAMANALSSKWPETQHRLCIWHIYQNVAIHLSHVMAKHKSFIDDFSRCIYEFEDEEDFFSGWNSMLEKYDLHDNAWLKRLFRIREKWALVYGRLNFCADMTTTQRSECMNSILKQYVSYKHKFLEFFTQFERLIEDRRYEELKADFKSNISFPALQVSCELLRHAASVYTPEVFNWFLKEWTSSMDATFEEHGGGGAVRKYVVTPHRKRYHHTVIHDASNGTFDCSCKKFEFSGILCSHVLKIFPLTNTLRIPDRYILKRWTRKAKTGHIGCGDSTANRSNLDPKVLYQMRYKDLCHLYVQLATKAAENEETYIIARKSLIDTIDTVDEGLQRHVFKGNPTCEVPSESQISCSTLLPSSVNQSAEEICDDVANKAKGIKRKKISSGKRLQGPLEKTTRKKKSTRNRGGPNISLPRESCLSYKQPGDMNQHPRFPVPLICYDKVQWTEHSDAQASVSNMVDPSYPNSYLFMQSSSHGRELCGGTIAPNSRAGVVGHNYNLGCTCHMPCEAGAFCPSLGYVIGIYVIERGGS